MTDITHTHESHSHTMTVSHTHMTVIDAQILDIKKWLLKLISNHFLGELFFDYADFACLISFLLFAISSFKNSAISHFSLNDNFIIAS